MKKKVLILILYLTIFFYYPSISNAVTMDEFRNAVANVSINTTTNYADEFVYSFYWGGTPSNPVKKTDETNRWLNNAKNGIKSSGKIYASMKSEAGIQGSFKDKFGVYCDTFVRLMVHHASNGAVSYPADYETINASEIRKGDLIHYPNHIAIYIDDAGDDNKSTNTVAESSGKLYYRVINRTPDGGYRLKASALAKLNYNYVTSSYDFHDRLDDAPPVITNVSVLNDTHKIKIVATDYKQYSLQEKSDILEPENNGIIAYQVNTSSSTPTSNWTKVNKTSNLNIEVSINKNGTYYVWVKDVGGNITSKQVKATNLVFDNIKPSLGELKYTITDTSIEININGASDASGIKEYVYYLDGKEIYRGGNASYLFHNLNYNQIYEFRYEVIDKKNNIASSSSSYIKTGVSAKKITLDSYSIELEKNDNYKINPNIEIDNTNYRINYQSDDTSIATVNQAGTVYAVGVGETNITIGVGETIVSLKVKVVSYDIQFVASTLPDAYVGEYYNASIFTNTNIHLSSGILPPGLKLEGFNITGTPLETNEAYYTFSITATSGPNTETKDFTIKVISKNNNSSSSSTKNSNQPTKKNGSEFIYLIIGIILVIILGIGYFLYKKKKQNNF